MRLVKKSFSTLLKRPLVLLYWAVIMVALFFAGKFVYELVYSFVYSSGDMFAEGATGENTLSTLMAFIMMVVNNIMSASFGPTIVIFVVLGLLVFALITALFFAGYNNTVYSAFNREAKSTDGFGAGIKQFFFRNSYVTVIFVFATIILALLAAVAWMPTLTAFLYAGQGQTSYSVAYVFVVLTAIVSLFVILYYLVYFTMWFPALCSGKERPFRLASFVINRNFWAIMIRYLFFGGVMVLVNLAFSTFMSVLSIPMTAIAPLIISALLNTVMISFFTVYVFTLFRFFFSKTKAEMRSMEADEV